MGTIGGHKEEGPPEFTDAPYAPHADGNRDTDAADSSCAKSAPGQNGAPGWRGRL